MDQLSPQSAASAGTSSSRRTFAIISHPDAGKTTLTEKLLLFGGAIHIAGQVKARGDRRRVHSDWMKIEQARGISVTTSVMTFEYEGATFNLLDTPGHEDFSEDTYRTLTAVDSAVMVIDAAKGIESQTRKLFEVCRLRDIPIMVFINKMDREGRDPFALIQEISDGLALDVAPMTWPVGAGLDFRGCYDIGGDRMLLLGGRNERLPSAIECRGLDDPRLVAAVSAEQLPRLQEDVALIREACPAMAVEAYRAGHLAPVFFGSALHNFGVRELLDALVAYAPPPGPQPAEPRRVEPGEPKVSGFVFKVQANMDPNHHDRVAFVRLCSGRLKRGMKLALVRTGKPITIHNPIFFFAQGRELAEEAGAGDIVGLPNHGVLRVGDTLSEGEALRFTGIPNFAPEILRRVSLPDAMKAKQLKRALESLAEEGVTQVLRPISGAAWIVGVVGALQLDVLASRLETEYGVAVAFEPAGYETARWIGPATAPDLARFVEANRSSIAEDRDGAPVFLARNAWALDQARRDWPGLSFTETKERS